MTMMIVEVMIMIIVSMTMMIVEVMMDKEIYRVLIVVAQIVFTSSSTFTSLGRPDAP